MSAVTKSGAKPKPARKRKKSSVSYPHEKLIRVNAEDLKNYKPPAHEIERVRRMEDSDIDYSDIPPMSQEQLARMVRLRDRQPKTLISVRLETRVLDWLKSKGKGHLTLINDILANVMEAEQQTQPRPK